MHMASALSLHLGVVMVPIKLMLGHKLTLMVIANSWMAETATYLFKGCLGSAKDIRSQQVISRYRLSKGRGPKLTQLVFI